jgi:polysaccharide biosynthesis transport protein
VLLAPGLTKSPMSEPEPAEANLRSYLEILRRRFSWIVVVTAVTLALAAVFVSLQKQQFSATTQLLLQPATGSIPISGAPQTISPTDVLTELQLMTSAPVRAQAAKKLGYEPNVSEAEAGQTNVIQVTGTGPTPAGAASVANIYSRVFVAYQRQNAINALTAAEGQYQSQINALDAQIQTLETSPPSATASTVSALTSQVTILKEELAQLQVTGSETPGGIEIVSLASPPSSPISPRPVREGAIALILGLLLGAGAALVAEYFDDKIYTRAQAEKLSGGLPVLAVVPKIAAWAKGGHGELITSTDPLSHVAESYRSLRTSLQFAGHDRPLKTILVTSPAGSEGKTSTVANLGVVLANAGERIVIVGCDLRRPRVGQFFHMTESPGFTSVLLGHDDLTTAVRPVNEVPGLALLTAGPIPPNPADLLGSDKAADILRHLAKDFDVVLIDGPPVLPVTDALLMSRYADAVVMVVAAGQTTGPQIERAAGLLRQADARTVGLVLNKAVRRGGAAEYGYKYGYKYRYKNRYDPEEASTTAVNGNGHAPVESDVPSAQRT